VPFRDVSALGNDTAMTTQGHGGANFATVELRDLNVLHWRGSRAPVAAPEAVTGRDTFAIDTCQRRVTVVSGRDAVTRARLEFPADGALEIFEGADAYAFLLRFACGLESKLVAETEIFGQIKQAWRNFCEQGSPLARQLSPWIQLLFQDAKAVRAQHLAKLGSASYGSQVRRLLGEDAKDGPTLLIGAGQLAQSVAPWLTGSQLWLWNRTAERAVELSRELAKRDATRPVRVIEGDISAELAAWRAARNVIICIPADEKLDPARIAAWNERSERAGCVVHLGLGIDGATAWNALPQLVSLGALFEMLQAQSELRRRQIERARRTCLEKALLRSLGANSSHPHSWEDLAAFHSL
jgi:glutamyl-tRNA reductase